METWIEIQLTVDVQYIESAGAIASMTVPYGIYIEDYSDLEQGAMEIAKIDLIDEELLKKDRTKGIVHIYITPDINYREAVSFLEQRLKAENIPYTLSLSDCRREDWENNWKQYFKPLKVGKKLLIHPIWVEDYEADGRKVLDIEPGIAFGTGGHETTRLCMEAMEDYITSDTVMLDVGCGSGILSVAGMLLGAQSVVGVDIDELAVNVAVENGKMNGYCAPAYTMIHGNLTDKISGKYNVVTANIVADAIMMLTPDVKKFLTDDAVYIVSGIIDTRADEVINVLQQNGFYVASRFDDAGWVCMVCKINHK